MANSIKNIFTEAGLSRVAYKITEILEDSGFQMDKDLAYVGDWVIQGQCGKQGPNE